MNADNQNVVIRPATTQDIKGIKDLLGLYSFQRLTTEEQKNGWVTGNISEEQLQKYLDSNQFMSVLVDSEEKVQGVAMGCSWDFLEPGFSPILDRMTEVLGNFQCNGETLNHENSYLYGPICLDKDFRSGGLAKQLFESHISQAAGRYQYSAAYIHEKNPRSQAFHSKMGYKTLGTFEANKQHFIFVVRPV